MDSNIIEFIDSIDNKNTAKIVKLLMDKISDDITNYNTIELEELLISLKPNSPREIITNCYVLSLYAKWCMDKGLTNNSFLNNVMSLNKKSIWKQAKPISSGKFISFEKYKELIHDIGVYEEFNSLYYQCLISCIYEGIYSDDLSVIKNLRGKDINKNIVTIRNDNGDVHQIEIPYSLADDLIELSETNTWERKNRYNIFTVDTIGLYPDSCFKVENRHRYGCKDDGSSYKFAYYSRIRKISKDYMDYNLLPLQIFVSGIMHRIKIRLNDNNITIEEAFKPEGRNRLVGRIISDELKRCNNNILVRNFREIVKGHVDVFSK